MRRLVTPIAVRHWIRKAPVETAFLFDLLPEDVRSSIGGRETQSNFSAMLSRSPMFVSHGRMGWTLSTSVAADSASHEEADSVNAALDDGGADS